MPWRIQAGSVGTGPQGEKSDIHCDKLGFITRSIYLWHIALDPKSRVLGCPLP